MVQKINLGSFSPHIEIAATKKSEQSREKPIRDSLSIMQVVPKKEGFCACIFKAISGVWNWLLDCLCCRKKKSDTQDISLSQASSSTKPKTEEKTVVSERRIKTDSDSFPYFVEIRNQVETIPSDKKFGTLKELTTKTLHGSYDQFKSCVFSLQKMYISSISKQSKAEGEDEINSALMQEKVKALQEAIKDIMAKAKFCCDLFESSRNDLPTEAPSYNYNKIRRDLENLEKSFVRSMQNAGVPPQMIKEYQSFWVRMGLECGNLPSLLQSWRMHDFDKRYPMTEQEKALIF